MKKVYVMNIKSLASTFVDKSDGFSHMSDGFSKDDYREFIDVVRKRLSSARWSGDRWSGGKTEFDLKFKGSNFDIAAYIHGLSVSVSVKFLNDKREPVSASGFIYKLDISEASNTGGFYTMFTERVVKA